MSDSVSQNSVPRGKAASSKAASPKAASPKAASPKAASPKTVSQKPALPKLGKSYQILERPQITASELKELIKERCDYLDRLISAQKKICNVLPDGHLKGNTHGNHWEYYWREPSVGSSWSYLRTNNLLINKLAWKSYGKRVLAEAEREWNGLKKVEKMIGENEFEQVYSALPESIRRLVLPVGETDVQCWERWKDVQFVPMGFRPEDPVYQTKFGERVRSKSEIMIAEALRESKIPYIYEKPLVLGKHAVHPDFTLMDFRKRREIYWEHLGMLDDPKYLELSLRKITAYESNGILRGDRLILTYETSNLPLDSEQIRRVIERLGDCRLNGSKVD